MLLIFAAFCGSLQDNASGIWLAHAARLSSASSFFSCLKIPANSALTSLRSRWGMALPHIALFMHHTALSGSRGKESGNGSEESRVSIGDNQVHLCRPTGAQVLQEATPAVFIFLRTGPQGQHVLVPVQIHAKCR